MKIKIGSRGSALAIKQTELVLNKLKKAYPEHEYSIQVIQTKGDKIQDIALDKMNDKGIFVKEIEQALLNNTIQLAVHSLKDMPSVSPVGLVYANTLAPSDARDCLVLKEYPSLEALPQHAIIATGSKRRKFQLLKLRPDLQVIGIRGNINTRIQKMKDGNIDGLVLASAGLQRLGIEDQITEYFSVSQMVPACGQGILALQVQKDSPLLTMINNISNTTINTRMEIERLFLHSVNGSCHIPVGSHAHIVLDTVHFYAVLGNEEGTRLETIETSFPISNAKQAVPEIAKELMRKIYA